jgi:hypothetical protein
LTVVPDWGDVRIDLVYQEVLGDAVSALGSAAADISAWKRSRVGGLGGRLWPGRERYKWCSWLSAFTHSLVVMVCLAGRFLPYWLSETTHW